jgi:hypothetical protein
MPTGRPPPVEPVGMVTAGKAAWAARSVLVGMGREWGAFVSKAPSSMSVREGAGILTLG